MKGFFWEVDLEYPKESHEFYNDHLLTLDKREIKKKMLSNYQLKITAYYNIKNVKKLMTNVFDKEKYALNYENLQVLDSS